MLQEASNELDSAHESKNYQPRFLSPKPLADTEITMRA
jgi:hypothetical protein